MMVVVGHPYPHERMHRPAASNNRRAPGQAWSEGQGWCGLQGGLQQAPPTHTLPKRLKLLEVRPKPKREAVCPRW